MVPRRPLTWALAVDGLRMIETSPNKVSIAFSNLNLGPAIGALVIFMRFDENTILNLPSNQVGGSGVSCRLAD